MKLATPILLLTTMIAAARPLSDAGMDRMGNANSMEEALQIYVKETIDYTDPIPIKEKDEDGNERVVGFQNTYEEQEARYTEEVKTEANRISDEAHNTAAQRGEALQNQTEEQTTRANREREAGEERAETAAARVRSARQNNPQYEGQALGRIDINRDGTIEEWEVEAEKANRLCLSPQTRGTQLDKDGDGNLSETEAGNTSTEKVLSHREQIRRERAAQREREAEEE